MWRTTATGTMAGPRTQRYAAGLAMLFTATDTISLRADALPTDLPTAVENHNTATTDRLGEKREGRGLRRALGRLGSGGRI